MKNRTPNISASSYIETNTATSFEVQKRKVGYHGTVNKDKNCRTCVHSNFQRTPNGSFVSSTKNCSKCPFTIGEYGVCRHWKGRPTNRGLDFLDGLGLDEILKGGG